MFFHGGRNTAKNIIATLDAWTWSKDGPEHKYFSEIATSINVWLSTGVATKFRKVALSIQGASPYVKVLPGRVIRGRWAAVDNPEGMSKAGGLVLGIIFQKVFPKSHAAVAADGAKKRRVKSAAEDEAEEYQEAQKNYRARAVATMNNRLFHTMVHISHTSKQPLCRFLFWGQKLNLQHRELKQRALDTGGTYMGKTPLSEFVAWKAAQINQLLSNLLDEAAVEDRKYWGTVWDHCPVDMRSEALELVIACALKVSTLTPYDYNCFFIYFQNRLKSNAFVPESILKACGGWHHRVMMYVSTFPYLLLLLLEVAAHIVDGRRKLIAGLLLSTDDCCLRDRYTDIAIKIKAQFHDELERVRDTGRMPLNLFGYLLGVRAQLDLDTQDMEGFISVLQNVTFRGRNMTLPTATARMSLKLGEELTIEDCLVMHTAAVAEMETDRHAQRFMLQKVNVPVARPLHPCAHKLPEKSPYCLGYALTIAHDMELSGGVAHWFVLEGMPPPKTAHLFGWRFSLNMLGARCTIDERKLTRDAPLVQEYLKDVIFRVLSGGENKKLYWCSSRVSWLWPNFRSGVLDAEVTRKFVKRRVFLPRPAAAAAPAAG